MNAVAINSYQRLEIISNGRMYICTVAIYKPYNNFKIWGGKEWLYYTPSQTYILDERHSEVFGTTDRETWRCHYIRITSLVIDDINYFEICYDNSTV